MTTVNKTAQTLDEGIKNLMAGAKDDYVKWSTIGGKELTGYSKEQVDNWENSFRLHTGKKYIWVVKENGVFCFIVREDSGKFKKDNIKWILMKDMLMVKSIR